MRGALAAVVLLVACSPSAVAPPAVTPVETSSTTTTTTLALAGVDAAAGVGDRMFPALGNEGYDVVSYDITLVFDATLTSVEGVVTIEAVAALPLRSFTVDLVGYIVESVEVDGTNAEHARGPRDMRITPAVAIPPGETFTVDIHYHGRPTPVTLTEFPFPTGWQIGQVGSAFLFSQPDGASGIFPLNDHPRDRADVTLTVSVPAPLVVVSGGEPAPVVDRDGLRIHSFEIPNVAPYLIPLAIGDFAPVEVGGVTTWMGNGAPLPDGFERQGEILRRLEADLGPYPFAASGAVVVDSDFPAALETQTLATYTTTSAAWGTPVVAHELAHQWFGNEIALGQWDDIWLNEGFATFMTWRWIEHDRGRGAYEAEVVRAWEAMAASDLGPPDDPPGQNLFDPSVYQRGGLALAALREFVGDRQFFEFLRSYVAEFSGSTVTTETFLTFVLIVLGPDAEDLVIDWVREPDMPSYPLG